MGIAGDESGATPGPPAGWYPVDGAQRYWDGARWTEHTAPVAGPAAHASGPSAPAPSPFGPSGMVRGPEGPVTSDDRTLAVLIHVLALFTGFLAPLIIWLIKREESSFIDDHGKEALNFQITLMIAWFVVALASIILIGLLAIPVLLVIHFLFPILAAMAAGRGERYRYPLTLRLIP